MVVLHWVTPDDPLGNVAMDTREPVDAICFGYLPCSTGGGAFGDRSVSALRCTYHWFSIRICFTGDATPALVPLAG